MTEDPKKTVDELIDQLVEEELSLSDDELKHELEVDGATAGDAAERAAMVLKNVVGTEDKAAAEPTSDGSSQPRDRRGAASTRQTSGVAYEFEDYVSAWFLVRAMSGLPVPGFDRSLSKIEFQTGALGWRLDDLLLSIGGDGDARGQLALSCKSNRQVTASGLPSEFMEAAWSDWTRLTAEQRTSIQCGLIVRGQAGGFFETWTDIKDWLSQGVTPLALARITQSQKHRRVFNSVAGSAGRQDGEVGEFVRCLQVVSTDFQIEGSKDEEGAIERCRDLLTSTLWDEGRALWDALLERAREARTTHGSIDVSRLWAELRVRFDLRDHPDLAGSWDALRQISEDCHERIVEALPNGFVLQREADRSKFSSLLSQTTLCAVHGESGVGKSALVAAVLDASFANCVQVWLRPEDLERALSPATRSTAGLRRGLERVLLGSPNPKNILVLDAIERLSPDMALKVKNLIEELVRENTDEAAWRIVVIGQTEAGAATRTMLGVPENAQIALDVISEKDVQSALRSSERLAWLAHQPDAVAALRNLSTLSFVMQAEPVFAAEGGSFSKSAIAERLWSWWTGDSDALGGLMVRLAVRDGAFERGLRVSELEAAQALVLEKRTLRTPLRVNRFKTIEFVHDMAADWARYQRLREIALETESWAQLAENPIWLPALRMLGEFLLREEVEGESLWGIAFRTLEQARATAAMDVLLDALCLDPLADQYLNERADLLFANDGAFLFRLLRRFLHVATSPSVPAHVLALDPSLRIYFEAHHRAPVIARWPAMVRFLDARRQQVAELMWKDVARLCEIWLGSVPTELPGLERVPFREELARLALANARVLQTAHGKNYIIPGGEPEIYKGAFAGATDIPEEVAEWALEMCGRRDVHPDVQAAIADYRRIRAQEHLERMRTDAEYRERHENSRSMASFAGLGERKLPPWPLGARRRIDHDFREACLHKSALNELMKVRPDIAGEVLLACIIDDQPTASRDRAIDRDLGLAFDTEAYPTIYWSSPFLTFLWLATDQAMSSLLALVEFCTDRWAAPSRGQAYAVEIDLGAAGRRRFTGNYSVFEWVEAESSGSGQLYCALAALEFWLCVQLDAGQHVEPVLERLLERSNSAAILGVLVNVGKHKPVLFKSVLKPLLASRELYRWDDHRVRDKRGFRFNVMHWARSGETMFEMAKAWAFARRHEITLSQVAHELMLADDDIATYLQHAAQAWPRSENEKDRLELLLLAAQLDRANYERGADGEFAFKLPSALERDVDAFNAAHAPKRVALTLPMQCLNFLGRGGALSAGDCSGLLQVLSAEWSGGQQGDDGDRDDKDEDDERTERSARIAAAGTLLARGRDFLRENPSAARQATEVIEAAAHEIGDDAESLRNARFTFGSYDILFVAYAATEGWIAEPDSAWPKTVLRLISSRRDGVISTLMRAARGAAERLGEGRRALENAALLWSALSALAPRYDADDAAKQRWENWVRRFRNLCLSDLDTVKIDLSDLAERVERIAAIQRARTDEDDDVRPPPRARGRKRALRTGLDNDVLAQVYDEVLNHERKGELDTAEDRGAVLALWTLYVRTLEEHADDDGEYSLPDRLGYEVVNTLARMTGYAPAEEATKLWRSLLELGPKGYHAVDYFLGLWFLHPGRGVDRAHFVQQWRQMAEFVLKARVWNGKKLWYRREHSLRQVLGFGSDRSIVHLDGAQAAVSSLWDLYESWAEEHLAVDEDNITGFAQFLASDAARDIRLRGCILMANHIASPGEKPYWRADRAGAALVDLVEAVLAKHADEVKAKPLVRDAVLKMVAALAAKNTSGALVLQERIRELK